MKKTITFVYLLAFLLPLKCFSEITLTASYIEEDIFHNVYFELDIGDSFFEGSGILGEFELFIITPNYRNRQLLLKCRRA